jgi:hypothetical protein
VPFSHEIFGAGCRRNLTLVARVSLTKENSCMADGTDHLLPLMNVLAPFVLLAFIAYLVWRGRLGWRSQRQQEKSTDDLYRREEESRQRLEEATDRKDI